MICLWDSVLDSDGAQKLRLSAEDYARFLKSIQRMSSLNLLPFTEDVTVAEFSLIYTAEAAAGKNGGKPVSVAEAAAMLSVSVPAVSRTLKSLESKRLVERHSDDRDRRSVKLVVTEKGSEVLKRNVCCLSALLERVLSHFSDEELVTMVDLHCKLTEAFAEEAGGGKQRCTDTL